MTTYTSSIVVLCCLVLLETILGNHPGLGNETLVYEALVKIQADINANISAFCYHANSGTKQAFVSNAYSKFVGHHNVLVYPFCLMTNELGNRLGNYIEELACAEASGIHFITVHPNWDISGSFHGNSSKSKFEDKSRLAFLNALPSVVVHKDPVDRFTAIDKINHECKCARYCWQHANAPWVNRTASIKKYINRAVDAYLEHIDMKQSSEFDPEVDFTNAKKDEFLPIIPDVAIQYRCGDNIAFSYMYGILPFTAFDGKIPKDTKYIYVLSDHPSRAVNSPYTVRCHQILQTLMDYLKERYPHTIILIKRGGDLFLDYARLNKAKVTICSASSYCFWPALANENHVYFPVTYLIAGADTLDLAPNFGPNFHWIGEPGIISNFKNYRPWTQVLDVLTEQVKFISVGPVLIHMSHNKVSPLGGGELKFGGVNQCGCCIVSFTDCRSVDCLSLEHRCVCPFLDEKVTCFQIQGNKSYFWLSEVFLVQPTPTCNCYVKIFPVQCFMCHDKGGMGAASQPFAPSVDSVDTSSSMFLCGSFCNNVNIFYKWPDLCGAHSNGTWLCCVNEAMSKPLCFGGSGGVPGAWCILFKGSVRVERPTTLCKQMSQVLCCDQRCAFPCDGDVPCLCSLLPFCVLFSNFKVTPKCFPHMGELK